MKKIKEHKEEKKIRKQRGGCMKEKIRQKTEGKKRK